jgi:hypothetical protein
MLAPKATGTAKSVGCFHRATVMYLASPAVCWMEPPVMSGATDAGEIGTRTTGPPPRRPRNHFFATTAEKPQSMMRVCTIAQTLYGMG